MRGKRAKRQLPKWEELSSDEILSLYPDQFLDCRGSHNWGRRPIYKLIGPDVWEVSVGCECGTQKKYWIDGRSKRIIREPYTYYPSGYQTPRTGLTRSDFKTAYHTRDFARAERDGRVFRGNAQDSEEITEPKGNAA